MRLIRHFCISFFCFTWLLNYSAQAQNFDINLLKAINPQHPNSVVWKTASGSFDFVSGAVSIGSLAYALIEKDKGLRYKSYELLIAQGINIVTTTGLKAIFNRQRPVQSYPNDISVLVYSDGHSFPSGHTSLAFSTATSLAIIFKKWYITVPAYAWAACVGYSRMYLGRHYPSDVLGGAVVGAGSSLLSHWISGKLFAPKTTAPASPAAL